jgi:hypothetical protein
LRWKSKLQTLAEELRKHPFDTTAMKDGEVKEEVKHKLNRQTRALETSYEPSGKEQRSLDARLLVRSFGSEASFVMAEFVTHRSFGLSA